MRVLYADFNDFDVCGDLPLTCRGSVSAIDGLVLPLSSGEIVVVSDGELMAIAQVRQAQGHWIARCLTPIVDAGPEAYEALVSQLHS